MCDAVVPDGRPAVVVGNSPEKVTCTLIVLSTSSMVTNAVPVPGEAFGGDSLRPLMFAV